MPPLVMLTYGTQSGTTGMSRDWLSMFRLEPFARLYGPPAAPEANRHSWCVLNGVFPF